MRGSGRPSATNETQRCKYSALSVFRRTLRIVRISCKKDGTSGQRICSRSASSSRILPKRIDGLIGLAI